MFHYHLFLRTCLENGGLNAFYLRLFVAKNKNFSEASRLLPDSARLSLKTSSCTKIKPPAKCIIIHYSMLGWERGWKRRLRVWHIFHTRNVSFSCDWACSHALPTTIFSSEIQFWMVKPSALYKAGFLFTRTWKFNYLLRVKQEWAQLLAQTVWEHPHVIIYSCVGMGHA